MSLHTKHANVEAPVDNSLLQAPPAHTAPANDTPVGPDPTVDATAVEGGGGEGGEEVIFGDEGGEVGGSEGVEGEWRERGDMGACRALLEDKSVAGVVRKLQQDQERFMADAAAAFLILFRIGAQFDPPLGLMV